jgi:hypothetical protein
MIEAFGALDSKFETNWRISRPPLGFNSSHTCRHELLLFWFILPSPCYE